MLADVKRMNISAGKVIGMSAGGTEEVSPAIKAEAVPAYNLNKNFHPKANGWLGYIVTIAEMRVYVAGDTDATEEAEAVVCDAAMIPIGGTYTMNTEEAAALINKMKPKYALPTHYGDIVGEATDGIDFAVDVDPGIETVLKMKI
jgi:L-ascorbate metabolism protein UlaG (beta-lactamase superfamily)